jgi:uncharacterized OB-fold protein
MTTRARVHAFGAEGWFTLDEEQPTLIGSRCSSCGTYVFPKRTGWCANPRCRGTELVDAPLSRRGKVWSYTDAQYQPPAPFVVPGDSTAQPPAACATSPGATRQSRFLERTPRATYRRPATPPVRFGPSSRSSGG